MNERRFGDGGLGDGWRFAVAVRGKEVVVEASGKLTVGPFLQQEFGCELWGIAWEIVIAAGDVGSVGVPDEGLGVEGDGVRGDGGVERGWELRFAGERCEEDAGEVSLSG